MLKINLTADELCRNSPPASENHIQIIRKLFQLIEMNNGLFQSSFRAVSEQFRSSFQWTAIDWAVSA